MNALINEFILQLSRLTLMRSVSALRADNRLLPFQMRGLQ